MLNSDKLKEIVYYLNFDKKAHPGSVEHFYHFLWGYLLPCMAQILKIQSNCPPASQVRFLFHTCGPVMDKLLHEIAGLFDLDYALVSREHNDAALTKILVPRWDIELANLALVPTANQSPAVEHWRASTAARLGGNISIVKKALMAKVAAAQSSNTMRALAGKFLILKRSAQPAFYERNGKAEVPGYGTARRSLVRLEETVQSLQKRNLPVALFEPGSVSLVEQIQVFSRCQGVAGIYGAEFANVIWMQPGTPVIWIYSASAKRLPWMTEQLSLLLRLRFMPIKAVDDSAPELPLELFSNWLLGAPIATSE